jgi:hypothetical protein
MTTYSDFDHTGQSNLGSIDLHAFQVANWGCFLGLHTWL